MESEGKTHVQVGVKAEWYLRPEPLTPCAIVARNQAARVLAQRLLTRKPEELARLQGVHAPGLLILMGEETDLPWVDGGVYLGRDPGVTGLLTPTTLTCSLPLPLLECALRRQVEVFHLPLAVLPTQNRIVMLGSASPVAAQTLAKWLEENA